MRLQLFRIRDSAFRKELQLKENFFTTTIIIIIIIIIIMRWSEWMMFSFFLKWNAEMLTRIISLASERRFASFSFVSRVSSSCWYKLYNSISSGGIGIDWPEK